jgi:RNA polymerase sigma factor (sigma-70 family)
VSSDVPATVAAIWRIESPRLIAALVWFVGDVGLAEDLAQDAMVIALERWPETGVPDEPAPWLMATAKHRAVDLLRRRGVYARKLARLAATPPEAPAGEPSGGDDDLLRLVFATCHPALTTESQVALVLKLLGGLTTDEIARAFLTSEATVSQRILRAKRTLADQPVTLELPDDLAGRLKAVLGVVYLIFNEGYAATAGDVWMRPGLCDEAMRLGRVLVGLLPHQAEVHGLSALMELQASRLRARTGPGGVPVLLLDQDRSRWDRLLIRRGRAALARAEALGTLGPYGLQAAIAACHARALTPEATDWGRIAALYELLSHVAPSAVVELNRAVAVGFAGDPMKALSIVDGLSAPLAAYPHLWAARGELLSRLGRGDEARQAFGRAAALTTNARERALFEARSR